VEIQDFVFASQEKTRRTGEGRMMVDLNHPTFPNLSSEILATLQSEFSDCQEECELFDQFFGPFADLGLITHPMNEALAAKWKHIVSKGVRKQTTVSVMSVLNCYSKNTTTIRKITPRFC